MSIFTVRLTVEFQAWLRGLRDLKGKLAVVARLQRLEIGNPGDSKFLGGGLSELRIDFGPGYRVYYLRRGDVLLVVLWGGDKGSQDRDIATARDIAAQIEDEP